MWDCYRRATMLEPLAAAVLRENVAGDFAEAGVYRGGLSIYLTALLLAARELQTSADDNERVGAAPKRQFWVADSFEGLPENRAYTQEWAARDGAAVENAEANWSARVVELVHTDRDMRGNTSRLFAASLEEVQSNFRQHLPQLGPTLRGVRFLRGYFARSLPRAPIARLALLRVDCDTYAAIFEVLTTLYPRLSVGGVIIFDE